jgi:DHA2 family multidrug resistance protein-like MFS transporter
MSYSAGAAIGPVAGGLLLERFWWGSVFLINVPVMVLLLVLAPALLPESRDEKAGRLDVSSAALSLAAVLGVIYGLKRIAEGDSAGIALLSVAAGLALAAAFVRRQAKLADPLIDLRLFRIPAFSTALAVNVLGFLTTFATFLFVAQYLQSVLGLTPLQAGFWSLPSALAFIAGSFLTPAIVRRFNAAQVIAGGMLMTAAGFAILSQAPDAQSSLGVLVAGQIVFSLGMTPVAVLNTDIVLGSAPPERAGAASALSETSFEFGAALGIALMGSVVTALYRGGFDAATGNAIPAAALEEARSTIGGAVQAASELASGAGARLLRVARDSYSDAFEISAWISAALAVAVALLALRMLRQRPAALSP